MTLRRGVAITAAQSAHARNPARAAGATGATLAAARISYVGRSWDAGLVLDRDVAAITAGSAVAAAAAIGSVAARPAVLIVFATLAVAAGAARSPRSALAAIAAIAAVAATRVDVDAGDEFSDHHGQGTAVLSGETIGPLRPVRPTIGGTSDGPPVIAVPVADGILPLPAGSAGLSIGPIRPVPA